MATASETLVSPVQSLDASYDRAAAGRRRVHDVHDPRAARELLADRDTSAGRWPTRRTTWPSHLAGPKLGGLRFDYRRPKHPYSDKFMLAGGHCIPTCYALWMIMGQALERRYHGHRQPALLRRSRRGDPADRRARLPARRRRAHDRCCRIRASPTCRSSRRPRRAASRRWPVTPRASTSPTTSTAVPRASASPPPPARRRSGTSPARRWTAPKIIAFEGEFAMTEGHAQELKTQALALQDRQAAARDDLRQQRRHRRFADRRRHRQRSTTAIACRAVDVVRLERLRRRRRQRLRAGRRRR